MLTHPFRLLTLLVALTTGLASTGAAEMSGSATGTIERSTVNDFDCTTTDIPASECEALIALHEATAASEWWEGTLWLKTPEVCKKWAGVICDDETGQDPHVTSLLLRNLDLTGQIPEELAQLTELESLILSENLLDGEIPPELAELENLNNISLHHNLLTGQIPPELADMPNLTSLYLYNNSLNGPIPEALMGGNCVNCPTPNGKYGFLNLSNNNFSGELPQDIGRLDISTLFFQNNPLLEGPIPDTYPQLLKLTHFYFHSTGVCIPSNPEVLEWFDTITSITSTQPDCDDFEYIVSGHVLGSVGQPLDNVWVSTDNDQGAFTDEEGYFEFTAPGGDHIVTPTLAEFTFYPATLEVSLPPDATNLEFRGYSGSIITGRITDANGQPVKDIGLLTDTLDGGFTNEDGEYVIDMLNDGTYEVEPFSALFEFTPASRTVTVPPNATVVDFVATPIPLDPKVWAEGPGWSTTISPEIEDILVDLTPGNILKFVCPDEMRMAPSGCRFSSAHVILEAETGSQCELFRLSPLSTAASQTSPDTYEAWLKMALPLQTGRCSGLSRAGAADDEGSILTFQAGQEAFLFSTADSYLSLNIAGPTAFVSSQGLNTFSIDSQPDQGQTTIAVYSGRVEVTPAKPSLSPFEIVQGQIVTVTGFDVGVPKSLPHLFLPTIVATN